MPSLAAEARAFLRRRKGRRGPARAAASSFRVERRPIPPKPVSEAPIRSAPPAAPAVPALSPIAADLARILASPRAFPNALI